MKRAHSSRSRPPAQFIGLQDGCGIFPTFALYTLHAPVGVHPAGSTVSQQTLEAHGFEVGPEVEGGEPPPRESQSNPSFPLDESDGLIS